uniref:Uncharacterized protein n=1 Tax=Arundo donax TaxID=35708 RepID=A0A0A8ZTR3_ARUDO
MLGKVLHENYILLSTNMPKPMPRNVAVDMPKMPTRMPGTISELHPFAVAMAAAVVGPPTLALEAMSRDFLSSPTSLPTPSTTARWTVTYTSANANTLGTLVTASTTLPLAPTTVKNTCMRMSAMVSPAGASLPSCPGNTVARNTTSAVTHGRVPPWKPSRLAMADPTLQTTTERATAMPSFSTDNWLPPSESLLSSSEVLGSAGIFDANEKRVMKYKAEMRLSAATPAARIDGEMPSASETAT